MAANYEGTGTWPTAAGVGGTNPRIIPAIFESS